MISIPGSLCFAKLVMMSSTPGGGGRSRYMSQNPFIYGNQRCPIQSRLQSVIDCKKQLYMHYCRTNLLHKQQA